MPDIVLTTLNAKYIHAALGVRYLAANLGALKPCARILEFDIKASPAKVVEAVLAENPRIIGMGVYIWNAGPMREIIAALKRQRPDVPVVLGGPEVSFEIEDQEICRLADYVITGEGDLEFAQLCGQLLKGARPQGKVVRAAPVAVNQLALPYDLYTEDDIAHRIIYVETSRGCPYECEYCISSHDVPVRYFALPPVFQALEDLLARGARFFKFVDRTFNINVDHAIPVFHFFFERLRPGLFLHFEMMPDLFPERLRSVVRKFPPGVVQFEIGVQTFNEEVAARIKRRQDMAKVDENFRFLREQTGVVIHSDLIAGLPGETRESFAAGFDRLVGLRPQKIQVGILKRLRGCAIVRHDGEWGMVYAVDPPYEVLENRLIDRGTMDRIKRFARYWELIANRGNFEETLPLILGGAPFQSFLRLSDWLCTRLGRDYGIPLPDLTDAVFSWLTGELKLDRSSTVSTLVRDYQRAGRRDTPKVLRESTSS